MNKDLSRPCRLCPFRNDIRGYLTRARVVEIASSVLRGDSFPCHKTVEYDDGEGDVTDSQQCAGAEIFAGHYGTSSQLGRISERLGLAAKLDTDAPVCRSIKELLRVHAAKKVSVKKDGTTR